MARRSKRLQGAAPTRTVDVWREVRASTQDTSATRAARIMNVTLCDDCLPDQIETLTIGRFTSRPCDACTESVAPDAGGVVTVRGLLKHLEGILLAVSALRQA